MLRTYPDAEFCAISVLEKYPLQHQKKVLGAVFSNNIDVLEASLVELAEDTAKLPLSWEKEGLLFWLAALGHLDMLRHILETKLDPAKVDTMSWAIVLHGAVEGRHFDILEYVAWRVGQWPVQMDFPHLCSIRSHISSRAHRTWQPCEDKECISAVTLAVQRGSLDMLEAMLRMCNGDGRLLLGPDAACAAAARRDADLLFFVLDRVGAVVFLEQSPCFKCTALEEAVRAKNVGTVQAILNHLPPTRPLGARDVRFIVQRLSDKALVQFLHRVPKAADAVLAECAGTPRARALVAELAAAESLATQKLLPDLEAMCPAVGAALRAGRLVPPPLPVLVLHVVTQQTCLECRHLAPLLYHH